MKILVVEDNEELLENFITYHYDEGRHTLEIDLDFRNPVGRLDPLRTCPPTGGGGSSANAEQGDVMPFDGYKGVYHTTRPTHKNSGRTGSDLSTRPARKPSVRTGVVFFSFPNCI